MIGCRESLSQNREGRLQVRSQLLILMIWGQSFSPFHCSHLYYLIDGHCHSDTHLSIWSFITKMVLWLFFMVVFIWTPSSAQTSRERKAQQVFFLGLLVGQKSDSFATRQTIIYATTWILYCKKFFFFSFMMSCGVTKFLCCLPLSLGAYIIGAISIVSSS